jgi:signal transduction histidine kinase
MVGMRERALILGGRLEITAATGGGTCVRATFPKEQLI